MTRNRCLEPFHTTKGDAGTGLGLALGFGAVERHSGTMAIESEVGKGKTITICFPLRQTVLAVRTKEASSGKQVRALQASMASSSQR